MNARALFTTLLGAFIIGLCTLFVNSLFDIENLKAHDLRHEQRYNTIIKSLDRLHIKVDKLQDE